MAYDALVAADAPWGFWPLLDSESPIVGGSFADASGNARPLTVVSQVPTVETGPVAGEEGREWTTGAGYLETAATVAQPTTFTYEAWVKVDAYPAAETVIQCVRGDNASIGSTSGVYLKTDGRIRLFRYVGSLDPLTSANPLTLGVWHHVVCRVGAGGSSIRIDKVPAASDAVTSVYTYVSAPFVVRHGGTLGPSGTGAVSVAKPALWTSKLADAVVDAHYDAMTPTGVVAGLITETTTVLPAVVGLHGPGTYGYGVYGGGVYGEGELPSTTVDGGLVSETTVVFAGSVPAAGEVFGGVVVETTTVLGGTVTFGYSVTARNRTSGRSRGGVASWEWEPNVAPIPAGMSLGHEDLTALALELVGIVDGRPQVSEQKVSIPADRHRILVNNVDVTFFRDTPTPQLDYTLTEPLLYGPATLFLPQVFAAFEQPGEGDLSWLVPGARVKQQRVNADGVVTATDYKGRVIAFDTSGAEFRVEVGGEASGPAALRERQVPLYRQVKDLGRQIYNALSPLGVRVEPFLGTETGIETVVAGGTGLLDHIHRLHASGQKRNGDMLTTMPDETGAYVTGWKDRTTIHATGYPHDVQMPFNGRRDIAEEPNRVYGTGITPDGMRVLGGVYPGMIEGDTPDYPFTDGSSFGEGTTNADTDTGDGVSVMIQQLRVHGYVSRDDTPGGYDNDVVKGIDALQDDAGITHIVGSGTMTPETWRALFNLNRTGYSMSWSRIEPMAQKPYTKKWRRTADGSIIGRNPNYDPSRLIVDRNVDFGNGFTKRQMREFARGEIDNGSDNWVGDMVVTTGALIRGDHTPGDPITEADVMPAAEIKPGMNIRLPLFMGGIVVHVSGTRSAEGGTRSLHLDTRARDSVPVSQVILRDRETRKDPHRAFVRDHLSSGMVRDAVTEFSEVGGISGTSVRLTAGVWRVFEVSSGRAGIIERLKLVTNPNAEFSVAIFGQPISAEKLQGRIGDPLTDEGRENWNDETILNELDRDHLLLYAAGGPDAPCGYWPHVIDDTAILTGVWQDDAGFGYSVGPANVLRVAVCADRDTIIPAGRIMWPQLEPM